jgi:hypothetical protein
MVYKGCADLRRAFSVFAQHRVNSLVSGSLVFEVSIVCVLAISHYASGKIEQHALM